MKPNVWILKRKGKRGNSYAVQWRDFRTGKTKTKACGKNRQTAEYEAGKLRQMLEAGQRVGTTAITFDDFITEHLQAIEGKLSEAGCYEHGLVLRQFKEICEPRDLSVIDFPMLEKFQSERIKAKVSPATVNKSLRTLQGILERGVKRNYIVENPFKGNRKALFVREPEANHNLLEPDDFAALLEACPDDRWTGICTVGYFAGLRIGEILALEWSEIDFENKMLHVRNTESHLTKSRKNRNVPMSDEVFEALKAIEQHRFRSRYVFTSDNLKLKNGDKKMENNVQRDFTVIVKRADLVDSKNRPRFTLHDLRRTFVTDLMNDGLDPKSVQELAGHSNIQTTMKYYAMVRAKNLSAAIERRSQTNKIQEQQKRA